jgi:thiamine-phosphate pyrophosphorylase
LLLYYITDRRQFAGTESEQRSRVIETIAAAATAGIDLIQLREKDLSAKDLEILARQAVIAVEGTSARILINHRVDIAIGVGAHGVHLRSDAGELKPSQAASIFAHCGMDSPTIGVSCHSIQQIAVAESHGASFAVFGPVFEKNSERASAGLTCLAEACSVSDSPSSRMPVLALGGVTMENAGACLRAGADGIAAIRLFQHPPVALPEIVSRLRQMAASIPPRSHRRLHPYQSVRR